jgi:hypothetical protein
MGDVLARVELLARKYRDKRKETLMLFTAIFYIVIAIIAYVFYRQTSGLGRVAFIILALLIVIAVIKTLLLHQSLV